MVRPGRLIPLFCGALAISGCADSTTPSPVPARVLFSSGSALIGLRGNATLTPIVLDADDNLLVGHNVAWTTSDPAIATVSYAGVVNGIALGGPVTITATVGDVSGAVTARVVAGSLTITPMLSTMAVGTTAQLSAQVTDALGDPIAGAEITWVNDTPEVVSLDPSTLVLTGLAAGDASVRAIAAGRETVMPTLVGVPTSLDGSYSTEASASTQVQLEVVFGRIVRFNAIARPTTTCSVPVVATPFATIESGTGAFRFGSVGPGIVSGSVTAGAANGFIANVSNGGNTTCGFGPLATTIGSVNFAAFRP